MEACFTVRTFALAAAIALGAGAAAQGSSAQQRLELFDAHMHYKLWLV